MGAARKVLGAENVLEQDAPTLGTDDFGYFSDAARKADEGLGVGGNPSVVQQGEELPRGTAAPGTPNSGNMRISKALVQVGGPDCRRGGGVTAGGRAAAGTSDFDLKNKAPGCYFYIGVGNQAKGWTYPNHNPHFAADPAALPLAAAVEAQAAADYLSQEETAR